MGKVPPAGPQPTVTRSIPKSQRAKSDAAREKFWQENPDMKRQMMGARQKRLAAEKAEQDRRARKAG